MKTSAARSTPSTATSSAPPMASIIDSMDRVLHPRALHGAHKPTRRKSTPSIRTTTGQSVAMWRSATAITSTTCRTGTYTMCMAIMSMSM